jgi:hypothetical protein
MDETFGVLGLTAKWGSVRASRMITASPDAVWERIADVPNNASWFTSLAKSWCETDPDTGRPIRKVQMPTGATVTEDIVIVDHVQRRMQYQIRPIGMFTHHLATIDVIEMTDGTSMVVYSTDFAPKALALTFAAASERALETLKRQLENDSPVER